AALAVAAERARGVEDDAAEVHRRGRERDAERVQKDELRLLPHVGGHLREREPANEPTYPLRAALHFLFPDRFAGLGRPPSARMSGAILLSWSSPATRPIASAAAAGGSARRQQSRNFSASSSQLIGFSGWPRATSARPSTVLPSLSLTVTRERT